MRPGAEPAGIPQGHGRFHPRAQAWRGLHLDVPAGRQPGRRAGEGQVTPADHRAGLVRNHRAGRPQPRALACRLQFTAAAGTTEPPCACACRSARRCALARMKAAKLLAASRAVTVAASGCGMWDDP